MNASTHQTIRPHLIDRKHTPHSWLFSTSQIRKSKEDFLLIIIVIASHLISCNFISFFFGLFSMVSYLIRLLVHPETHGHTLSLLIHRCPILVHHAKAVSG